MITRRDLLVAAIAVSATLAGAIKVAPVDGLVMLTVGTAAAEGVDRV